MKSLVSVLLSILLLSSIITLIIFAIKTESSIGKSVKTTNDETDYLVVYLQMNKEYGIYRYKVVNKHQIYHTYDTNVVEYDTIETKTDDGCIINQAYSSSYEFALK